MRRKRDAYFTPQHATRRLREWLGGELGGGLLLDPSCGDGSMAAELAASFGAVSFNDAHAPTLASALSTAQARGLPVLAASALDACDGAVWATRPDWTVTNPPFYAAGDIARQALRRSSRGVALLLRCTFAERVGPSHACRKPKDGSPAILCDPSRCLRNGRLWLRYFPPTRVLALPRISFTEDGHTDSAPCWWFVWQRRPGGAGWQHGSIAYPTDESA